VTLVLVLGLTGPTGAGKGEVAALLSARGFTHIDGDALSRRVTGPGEPCLSALTEAFGPGILDQNGGLDRKKLGELVFSDPRSLSRLNAVIHPFITGRVRELLTQYEREGRRGAVIDGAALYESGLDGICRAVICVIAPYEQRLARIMARDGLSEKAARKRAGAQPDEARYRAGADFVIVNDGELSSLKKSVDKLVNALEKEYTMSKITRALFIAALALVVFAGIFHIVADRAARGMYPLAYADTVTRYADEYGVAPALAYAVIKVESGFRADAVSPRGAMGLMQLTPDTYRWAVWRQKGPVDEVSDNDLLDPEINIRYGIYVLSLHLAEYGDTDTALCAYNAGAGAVNSWLSDERYSADGLTVTSIPYPETKNYVKKVRSAIRAYEKLYFQKEN